MHPLLWVLVFVLIVWALFGGIVLNTSWLLVILLVVLIVALASRRNGRYP